ncbi:hypothetical protein DEU34_2296 [Microbacterium sp. AG1240]|uniref:hypothetical protein n=1 Tax=Microbacterium sp. AG1240 TaxID=2183992 RepID=UPI000EB35D95|nr:hypothetical protein [Microbacterium sp. AG1240]RKT33692.1 hypothetical protein DEU34_2296 [Microbacterium sp. AG1240]
MLIGTIRPTETRTVEVTGESLEDIQVKLEALRPAGFDLVKSTAHPVKGTMLLSSVGTFARREGSREIEADDRAALQAKIPDGYELLAIRVL